MCLGSLFLKLEFKSSAIQFHLSLSKVSTSIAKTRVSKTSIGMMSSISRISSIGRGSIGGPSDNSNIVGMSSSDGVGDRESICNLSNGVGIRISFSFTLAISIMSKTGITIGNRGSSISKISDTSISNMSSISSIGRGSIGGSSDNSNIVGTARSVGIGKGESIIYLSNGVGISIRRSFSFTLSKSIVVKTRITIGNRGSSISNMSNTGISSRCSITNMSSISTVANGTYSLHKTIAIVNTSYNTTVGASSCDLANGVGISITVSIDSGQGQKDKCKGSHLELAEQSS